MHFLTVKRNRSLRKVPFVLNWYWLYAIPTHFQVGKNLPQYVLLGSLSPGSPGAEMRISDSLTLDLCRCCTRVFGSASHPSISSPGHPVTGDMEQAVQGLGREVTRHTNELQHPLLEKKKTMKNSRFPVCRSEEEAFCNLRNFRP